MERFDRYWTNFTTSDVRNAAAGASPESYASAWITDTENFEYAELVLGRDLRIALEGGGQLHYVFAEKKSLTWSDGETSGECFYRAIEAPGFPDVVFVQHYCDGLVPARCITLVLDFGTGYATVVDATLGALARYPREASNRFIFGEIEGIEHPAGAARPSFTTDLVGKAIFWELPAFADKPGIKHIYLSQKYYGIAMTRPDGSVYQAADMADYIKVRDGLYLLTTIETRRSGVQLTFLINTQLLQDVFGMFGIAEGNEPGIDAPAISCSVMTGRQGHWDTLETLF